MKRDEEIAIASCAYGSRGSSFDFEVGARWADIHPKSPWISVEDDLPCNHKELVHEHCTDGVLAMSRHGDTEVAFMAKIFTEDAWKWHNLEFTVLYWMPIPKLSKEQESKL